MMPLSTWKHSFAVVLVLFSATIIGQADAVASGKRHAAAAPVKVQTVEGITEYKLANGLKVLLFPDVSKPTVAVNVTYLVGSRHENYGETGMAHLLEHLMFKGSTYNRDITQQLNQRGMRFNGTTNLDRTNYFEIFKATDDNLKWALQMEADRMTHSFIAKKDLDSEMTVVRNEFESGENSPFGVLQSRLQSMAFDWHNYGKTTIGNRSDIENVKIENLQAFYHTYYQPDNAVLIVTGKFDPKRTLALIAASFGKLPKPKRQLPQLWTQEPTQDGERSVTLRRKGDVQVVAVGYRVPGFLHPDTKALSFMASILADDTNGRLRKQLIENGLGVQVFTYGLDSLDPGLQVFGVAVKKDKPIGPVRDALIAAIEDFVKTPPTEAEMARVRLALQNSYEVALSDHESVVGLLSAYSAQGDWRLLFLSRDQVAAVTAADVSAAAAHYFRRDNRVVANFLPEDMPQRAVIAAAPTLADVMKDFKPKQTTSVAEAFDPSQANIDARTQHQTIGGLKLALLPKKNRGETVAVQMSMHWGDEKSLKGLSTASSMTDAMLMRGSRRFTREQLADEFDKLKISGGPHSFSTTRQNLPAALRLIASVLKEPSFPENEFEELRKLSLVAFEANRNEPQALASQSLAHHFDHYPKDDVRAVRSVDEQIADMKAVTLAQVHEFHRDFYGASRGEIAIVGDFDVPAAVAAIKESFGNWPSKSGYTRLPHSNGDIAPTRELIHTPEKENGFYVARQNLDLRSDDADYPALALANAIFGDGGLKSRLLDRIRQKDGLSYGGGSNIEAGDIDRAGSFSIAAIAAPQNLNKLEAAIREELQRALKDGFTQQELDEAKSSMLQQRQQNRAQDSILAAGWSSYLYLGRTFAWSRAYDEKLRTVTLTEVNGAFRRAIDPAKMSVVIAGDQEKAKK
jgi:zinc protease